MRTSLIVDCHSLYTGAEKSYPNFVVNYAELVSYYARTGTTLFHKIAYGRQPEQKVRPFATMLKKLGFDLEFFDRPHGVRMALFVAGLIESRATDQIVIGSSDPAVGPILRYARDRGIYTSAFGFDVPGWFNLHADVWELNHDFVQPRPTVPTVEAAVQG